MFKASVAGNKFMVAVVWGPLPSAVKLVFSLLNSAWVAGCIAVIS